MRTVSEVPIVYSCVPINLLLFLLSFCSCMLSFLLCSFVLLAYLLACVLYSFPSSLFSFLLSLLHSTVFGMCLMIEYFGENVSLQHSLFY